MSSSRILEEVRKRVRLEAGDNSITFLLLRLGVSGLLLAGIRRKIKGRG